MSEISTEFVKIIKDFLKDILTTFPEYKDSLNNHLQNIVLDKGSPEEIVTLYEFCSTIYPPRFFDILYKNEDIFNDASLNTFFLPGIDFSLLWKENIGDRTREIIWKYLQLILFSIVGSQKDGASFGDTAKFFEAIDEEEFKTKLEETIGGISEFFDSSENNYQFDSSNINMADLPDAEELHNHITGLLDGQLGMLAKEIAEETANEMNLDLDNVSTVGDVFQKLFKNPGKLMQIVKKVGQKLDDKMKSGEIKESEIMKEAADLMKKMNKMPGMKNMQSMFGNLGNMGGGKINTKAMQAHLNRNMKKALQKERLQEKLKRRREKKTQENKQTPPVNVIQKESYERSWANHSRELLETTPRTSKKKRKKKRRKNKKKT